jgi:hypothetical protein
MDDVQQIMTAQLGCGDNVDEAMKMGRREWREA